MEHFRAPRYMSLNFSSRTTKTLKLILQAKRTAVDRKKEGCNSFPLTSSVYHTSLLLLPLPFLMELTIFYDKETNPQLKLNCEKGKKDTKNFFMSQKQKDTVIKYGKQAS